MNKTRESSFKCYHCVFFAKVESEFISMNYCTQGLPLHQVKCNRFKGK